jgi:hypothetical protein
MQGIPRTLPLLILHQNLLNSFLQLILYNNGNILQINSTLLWNGFPLLLDFLDLPLIRVLVLLRNLG